MAEFMYRFRPDYIIKASRHIEDFPHKSKQAAWNHDDHFSNNLDYDIAQHPHELITYGGNGQYSKIGNNISFV